MWYHPAAFFVGYRDIVGAWILCLTIAGLVSLSLC